MAKTQPDPKTGRKPKARSPPRTANPTIRPFVITKRTAHRAKNRIKQKLVKGLAVSESLLVQAQAPVQPPTTNNRKATRVVRQKKKSSRRTEEWPGQWDMRRAAEERARIEMGEEIYQEGSGLLEDGYTLGVGWSDEDGEGESESEEEEEEEEEGQPRFLPWLDGVDVESDEEDEKEEMEWSATEGEGGDEEKKGGGGSGPGGGSGGGFGGSAVAQPILAN